MQLVRFRQAILIMLFGLLSACSLDGMIDAMTSEEDQVMAEAFVDAIRHRDSATIRQMVDADVWQNSAGQLDEAAGLFPSGDVESRIIAYSVHMESLDEGARTEKEFTVMTTDESHWTTTRFSTLQDGGGQRIVAWNVRGSDEPPEEMENMETVGRVFMWMGIVFLVFLVGMIVLIVWLVRRSRRRKQDAGVSSS